MIRIGFIGAGLIGKERVRAAEILMREKYLLQPTHLVDPHASGIAELAATICAKPSTDIEELIAAKPDWVVVAVPHDTAVEILPRLLAANIKVLVEKPLGRGLAEAETLAKRAAPGQLWIGQNYRFYAGIAALLADIKSGWFGQLTSVSLVLAHGGGPKDMGTWKIDPVRAGGGVIIDPGIHLLDLINCIEGGVPEIVGGTTWSGFWKTGIEEDVHVLLKGKTVPVYDYKVSLVRWRSLCRIEVHGLEGYGIVEGRGRSYGPQRYWRGPRWGWQKHKSQAESEEVILETDGADVFVEEMRSLLFGETKIPGAKPCSLAEALDNMRLIEGIRTAVGLAA